MQAECDVGGAVLKLVWSAYSDVGNVRTLNEDSMLAVPPVFVVADGMGGHEGGEVASALAVRALASIGEMTDVGRSDVIDIVEVANRIIHERSGGGERGMGTTLTGLVVTHSTAFPPAVTIVNVGDSRTYRVRDGALAQLTIDHSQVQELVERGLIAPADAATHPDRNIVTRALGIDVPVEVDTFRVDILAGDRFLVCSDGLTGELTTDEMLGVLGEADPAIAAARLVEQTLAGPARDNVSVIVLDVISVARKDMPEITVPRANERVGEQPERSADEITAPNPRAAHNAVPTPTNGHLIDVVPIAASAVVAGEPSVRSHRDDALLIDKVPSAINEPIDPPSAPVPMDDEG